MVFATSPAAFVHRYKYWQLAAAFCTETWLSLRTDTGRAVTTSVYGPVSTILLQFSFVSHRRRSRGQEGRDRPQVIDRGRKYTFAPPPAFGACVCMCSVSWLFSLSCRYLPSDWPERLLWRNLRGKEIISTKPRPKRAVRVCMTCCWWTICAKDSSWTDHGQPGASSDVRRAAARCRSPGNSSDGLFVNNNK